MPSPTLWTLPNAVSLSRVVLAAGFVASSGGAERLALVGVASFTDMLDGWLARRLGVVSRWGALIDPIADRIFVLAAVGTFVANGALSPLQALALLLRDVMTVIGFFVAKTVTWLRAVTFRARPLGKVVTVLQLATLVALTAVPRLVPALVAAVGAVAVAATVDYTLLLWRERARGPAAAGERPRAR
jgi:phosphatidylglycerophosphate synthase